MDLDRLLTDASFYQQPHKALQQLRLEAPVYWSEAWGVWVLTRYDDVVKTLKNHADFVNFGRVTHLINQLPAEASAARDALLFHYETGLAHTDPPIHTRLRSLLNLAFTPRMVAHWTHRIEAVVEQLIDTLRQQTSFDLLPTFAYPLPATIIAEMLGVAAEDTVLFQTWAVAINQLFEKGGRITVASAMTAHENLRHMRAYIGDMVKQRQRHPTEDIIGKLVSLAAGEKLTLDELTSTVVTFFVAGHDTTTNLIANSIYLLLQQPDAFAELRRKPALTNIAVEETLRLEPSVPRMWRIAMRNVKLNGSTIKQGQMVFPMLSAANRDPAQFPDPDRFSLTRKNMKHVAFGYGIHYCLGAPLARLEAEIALRKLIAAFPTMRLSATPHWTHDIAIRRLEQLVLTP